MPNYVSGFLGFMAKIAESAEVTEKPDDAWLEELRRNKKETKPDPKLMKDDLALAAAVTAAAGHILGGGEVQHLGISGVGGRIGRSAIFGTPSQTPFKGDVVSTAKRIQDLLGTSAELDVYQEIPSIGGGFHPRIKAWFDNMQAKRSLNLPPHSEQALRSGKITFSPKGGADIFAHEAGHASLARNKLQEVLWGLSRNPWLPRAGILGGAALVANEDPNLALLAPAPVIAAAAPQLADEGLASVRGLRALGQLGEYSPEALKGARVRLLKALGSYAAPTVLAAAPLAAIGAYRKFRTVRED
jgi:hypothetical protein